ncbi:MAG: NeuD/PglB/VioB family sugar acetyltransferase [Mucilaginibacter polytrichastri]|nr:NeuD/PglB/VioB family sugar acetyltransferase [Mucilaginibacter polytrichastri]
MPDKPRLVLIGGGGHCRACIDVIEREGRYRIIGILDQVEKVGQEVLGYPIVGTDDDIGVVCKGNVSALITIGQIKTSTPRQAIYNALNKLNVSLATVISPKATVSKHAEIGAGTIVMHHVMVNAGARVGVNAILNTGCIVEHDVVIGDHCHISTNAVVNGSCFIGNNVFVGSNSTLVQNIRVSDGSFVKAGQLLSGDI